MGREKRSVKRVSQEETVPREKKKSLSLHFRAGEEDPKGSYSKLERADEGAAGQTLGSNLNLRK